MSTDADPRRGARRISEVFSSSSTETLRIEVAWFANGGEEGKPALGTPETLLWEDIASIIADNRRVGEKDGCNFIPICFEREFG